MFNLGSDINDLSALVVLVYGFVSVYNSIRNRSKPHRSGIVPPKFSSWNYLYRNGDGASFLCITGLKRATFMLLHSVIFEEENAQYGEGEEPPRKSGRKPHLDTFGKLGICLIYVGSRMKIDHKCLIFGITPTVANDTINMMLSLVCDKLKKHPASRIRFPTAEEMKQYARLISRRETVMTLPFYVSLGFDFNGLGLDMEIIWQYLYICVEPLNHWQSTCHGRLEEILTQFYRFKALYEHWLVEWKVYQAQNV